LGPRTRRRLAWLLLALAFAGVSTIAVERSTTRSNDFDNFYDAAASVWHDGRVLRTKGTARYLPSFQVLISPLGALPIEPAAILWTALNLAGYALLAWLFARHFAVPLRSQGPAWFCVAPFVVNNLTLGQSGPVLLALATAGVAAAARGRERTGGALLGLAGLLKVFPAALLAVPAGLGRTRRPLVGAALAGLVVAAWVAVALGPGPAIDDGLRWLHEVSSKQTPQRLVRTVRSLRYNNQGLAITLARSFGDFSRGPAEAAPGSVQLLTLPMPWIWGLYYGLLAGLAGCFAAILRRLHPRRASPRVQLGALALAVPVMLAASPIVWTHYFLWLLPGFVYLADRPRRLVAIGCLSLAAIFWVPARGLGFHMALALAQFAWIGRDLWRRGAVSPAARA